MPKLERCPSCRTGILEEDGTCSCGYGVQRKREKQESKSERGNLLCAFNDKGQLCGYKGIISGSGAFYCREHWERVNGRTPDVIGNALPVIRPRKIRVQPQVMVRDREVRPLVEWTEGETFRHFRNRVAKSIAETREPGCDDDYEIPAQAGQG